MTNLAVPSPGSPSPGSPSPGRSSTVGVAGGDARVALACSTTVPWTVTPGMLDDRAVMAYTMGQCHALAMALAATTGWTPVVVIAHQSARPWKSWAALRDASGGWSEAVLARRWVHMAVAVGVEGTEANGRAYLDIEGLHWGRDLATRWSGPLPPVVANGDPAALVVPVPLARLEGVVEASWAVPRPDVALAETFLEALLASVTPLARREARPGWRG